MSRFVRVHKESQNTPLVENCKVADSFFTRLMGLIPYKELKEGDGLFFPKSNSAHTFFMRFPIDIVFLTKNNTVVGIEEIKPWKITKIHWKAKSMLEVPFGTCRKKQIQCGDKLEITPCFT